MSEPILTSGAARSVPLGGVMVVARAHPRVRIGGDERVRRSDTPAMEIDFVTLADAVEFAAKPPIRPHVGAMSPNHSSAAGILDGDPQLAWERPSGCGWCRRHYDRSRCPLGRGRRP